MPSQLGARDGAPLTSWDCRDVDLPHGIYVADRSPLKQQQFGSATKADRTAKPETAKVELSCAAMVIALVWVTDRPLEKPTP